MCVCVCVCVPAHACVYACVRVGVCVCMYVCVRPNWTLPTARGSVCHQLCSPSHNSEHSGEVDSISWLLRKQLGQRVVQRDN